MVSPVKSGPDYSSGSARLVKSRSPSKESSPISPTAPYLSSTTPSGSGLVQGSRALLPKLRTRAIATEDNTGYNPHVRSNSNDNTNWKLPHQHKKKLSGTNSPLPPLPPPSPEEDQHHLHNHGNSKIYHPAPIRTQRFRHQPRLSIPSESEDAGITSFTVIPHRSGPPPTPINSAGGLTPISPAPPQPSKQQQQPQQQNDFRFPISPPLSPESPTVVGKHTPIFERSAWTTASPSSPRPSEEYERRLKPVFYTFPNPPFTCWRGWVY